MKKNAILMVSFGTSYLDALEKTVDVLEHEVAETYPQYQVYRAFTSQMILNKLKRTQGLHFHNVREAMEQMMADQVERVIVQPTHIINGIENEKMLSELAEYRNHFASIQVGEPLLSSIEDYKKAVHALMGEVELAQDEVLLLMGHGTDHHATAAYPALEYVFHNLGYHNVFVGTVEGFPELEDVRKQLGNAALKKLVLFPFLLVAGDHARNDMAGKEDSWKTKLEANGYEVRPILRGLGELSGIRKIYMEHIEEVMRGETE